MGILTFIIILLVIVLVHEFGHFIVAKKSGIRVDEFGFGFPPKLYGKKFGETEYTINLFPIGGFVKIFGESPDEESLFGHFSKRSLVNKSKWVQVAVLGAGVAMNFLLAWVLFIAVFVIGAPYSVSDTIPAGGVIENPKLTVTYVEPASPVDRAGLKPGDVVVSVKSGQNELIQGNADVDAALRASIASDPNVPITIVYTRGASPSHMIEATPQMNEKLGRLAIGVAIEPVGHLHLPLHRAVIEGTKMMGSITSDVAAGLFGFLHGVLTGGANFKEVSGPVGIAGVAGDAAQLGIVSVLILTAVISINLGIINLLPFPALDGGRIAVVLVESLRKKPIQPRIINAINGAGFFFLLLLMAIITYNDISKLL